MAANRETIRAVRVTLESVDQPRLEDLSLTLRSLRDNLGVHEVRVRELASAMLELRAQMVGASYGRDLAVVNTREVELFVAPPNEPSSGE